MFKIISTSSLIQNIPIVTISGNETTVCLSPRGSALSKEITPALQYLMDNKQVIIIADKPAQSENTQNESGSFSEKIKITEVNSDKKENKEVQSSELESLTDISNLEESVNNTETPVEEKEVIEQPKKRGRRKKTDGGES